MPIFIALRLYVDKVDSDPFLLKLYICEHKNVIERVNALNFSRDLESVYFWAVHEWTFIS